MLLNLNLYFSHIKNEEPPPLKIQGIEIECKEVVKYFDILIDNKLSWSHQTKAVKLKISRGIGIIHAAKFLIPKSLLSNLYYSFVQSHLLYGISAWGSPLTCMSDLVKTSDKTINLVSKLTDLKFLHIDQLYQLECCKLIFNQKHKILPQNSLKFLTLLTKSIIKALVKQPSVGCTFTILTVFFPSKPFLADSGTLTV